MNRTQTAHLVKREYDAAVRESEQKGYDELRPEILARRLTDAACHINGNVDYDATRKFLTDRYAAGSDRPDDFLGEVASLLHNMPRRNSATRKLAAALAVALACVAAIVAIVTVLVVLPLGPFSDVATVIFAPFVIVVEFPLLAALPGTGFALGAFYSRRSAGSGCGVTVSASLAWFTYLGYEIMMREWAKTVTAPIRIDLLLVAPVLYVLTAAGLLQACRSLFNHARSAA